DLNGRPGEHVHEAHRAPLRCQDAVAELSFTPDARTRISPVEISNISALGSRRGGVMDFRILGPIEVFFEGRPLRLGGERQPMLLASLLLHANEAVPARRLLDELWDEPPGGGLAAVHTQVSRLRRVLADRIVTVGCGYSLRVEAQELDLERFRA